MLKLISRTCRLGYGRVAHAAITIESATIILLTTDHVVEVVSHSEFIEAEH